MFNMWLVVLCCAMLANLGLCTVLCFFHCFLSILANEMSRTLRTRSTLMQACLPDHIKSPRIFELHGQQVS
jgi:hypothetical protein